MLETTTPTMRPAYTPGRDRRLTPERQVPIARGSTLRSTLDFVTAASGPARAEAALARLAPEDRARVAAAGMTDEVPLSLALALWHAVDAEIGRDDPAWVERAGALSIDAYGAQLYGGILRKASPLEFLTQSVSLFRLYYQPGDMHVMDAGPGHALLRLVGFGAADALFCRRQTGGLGRAIVLAGGVAPRVRHVRCEVQGDAFCEWELKWSSGAE